MRGMTRNTNPEIVSIVFINIYSTLFLNVRVEMQLMVTGIG